MFMVKLTLLLLSLRMPGHSSQPLWLSRGSRKEKGLIFKPLLQLLFKLLATVTNDMSLKLFPLLFVAVQIGEQCDPCGSYIMLRA